MELGVADFETVNKSDDCRVWAWAYTKMDDIENVIIGKDLKSFMHFIGEGNHNINKKIYFHNLRFDASFILDYLLRNGYKYIDKSEKPQDKTFSTLITDMDVMYSLTIYFYGGKHPSKVEFNDSLKLIPKSVEQIAKDFNLGESKGIIEYNKERELDYDLNENEKEYISNDVKIVAKALIEMFKFKIDRLTLSSSALKFYKDITDNFERKFPRISNEEDLNMRAAYKGGFTFLNSEYEEKDIKDVVCLDVNSLYPSQMRNRPLPYGKPIKFTGEPKNNIIYDLWVANFDCEFELKENFIPTIQIKHSLFYKGNEYLTSSDGEIVNLTMTNVDFMIFSKHYDIYNLEWNGGYYFLSTDLNFKQYVDYWYEQKNNAKHENNDSLYTISKLMQNSLYGKFAFSPYGKKKIPYLDDETDRVKFKLGETEELNPVYLPVAIFVTAWARYTTISASQLIYEQKTETGESFYIYSDTDSIHYINGADLSGIEVDEYKLGAWKIEKKCDRARYLRQKTYIMEKDEKLSVTCAGMPSKIHDQVTWENFHKGVTYHGKLAQKRVKGGIILSETDFTIR